MTMLVVGYDSKKELKQCIGRKLQYVETSAFGPEYRSNGTFSVAHRPSLGYWAKGKEFFATVTMENDLIKKVE